MKARRVKGIDPAAPVADGAQRTVLLRLDELCGLATTAVGDPEHVTELHDARIAAKRLRYVLEVTEHLFGPYARDARKRAKELQDLLGEIHDCDVTLPEVRALRKRLVRDSASALAAAARDAGLDDLDGSQAADADHHTAWRGLTTIEVHLRARRDLLFTRFVELWTLLGREGFRARLEFAVHERSHDPGPI